MKNIIITILIIVGVLLTVLKYESNNNEYKYTENNKVTHIIDSLKEERSIIMETTYIYNDSIDSLKDRRHIVHEDIDSTQIGSYIENEAIVNTLNIIEYQDTLIDTLVYMNKITNDIVHNLEIKEANFKNMLSEKEKEIKKIKRKNIFIIISATLVGILSIMIKVFYSD